MTPEALAKSDSEHAHQRALFAWANMARLHGFDAADDPQSYTVRGYAAETYKDGTPISSLTMLFAVPNGGLRSKATAAKLKAEGVKRGYPDVALDYPSGSHHGLRIEMKKQGGRTSPEQEKWLENLNNAGYLAVVCVGWEAAANIIKSYLQ